MLLYEARTIFKLPENYTKEDVNRIYRDLMKRWHPDVNKSTLAESKTKQINEAKEVLIKALNNSYTNTNRKHSTTKNNNYSNKTSFYAEMLKRRVSSFKISDVSTDEIFVTINKINALINEYEKLYNGDLYYFNIYSHKIDLLFIEYAKNFCDTYGLKFSFNGDGIFINSTFIIFKDASLKQFVEVIEKYSYLPIYNNCYNSLLHYISINGEKINLDSNVNVDISIRELYIKIENIIVKFVEREKNCSKTLNLLTANYVRSIRAITKEIISYIDNYCSLNSLSFSIGESFSVCEVNGTKIFTGLPILDMYNNLIKLKDEMSLNLKK